MEGRETSAGRPLSSRLLQLAREADEAEAAGRLDLTSPLSAAASPDSLCGSDSRLLQAAGEGDAAGPPASSGTVSPRSRGLGNPIPFGDRQHARRLTSLPYRRTSSACLIPLLSSSAEGRTPWRGEETPEARGLVSVSAHASGAQTRARESRVSSVASDCEEGEVSPLFSRRERPRQETVALPPLPRSSVAHAGLAADSGKSLHFREAEVVAALAPASFARTLSRLRTRGRTREGEETGAVLEREVPNEDGPECAPVAATPCVPEKEREKERGRERRLVEGSREEGRRGADAGFLGPSGEREWREVSLEDESAQPMVSFAPGQNRMRHLRYQRSSSWEPSTAAAFGSQPPTGTGANRAPLRAGLARAGLQGPSPPAQNGAANSRSGGPAHWGAVPNACSSFATGSSPASAAGAVAVPDLAASVALQHQMVRLAEELLYSPEESFHSGPVQRGAHPSSSAYPPASFTFHEQQQSLFHLDKTRVPVLASSGSNADSLGPWEALSPNGPARFGGTVTPGSLLGGPGYPTRGSEGTFDFDAPRRDSTGFWAFTGVWADQDAAAAEFKKIAAARGGNGLMTLHAFRLLVTIFVILDVLKFGASTYFPPSNYTAFLVFLFLNLGVWLFFLAEAALKIRLLGFRRYMNSLFTFFDGFLLLIQSAALAVRFAIVLDPDGVGKPVFDPGSVERDDSIVNEFMQSRIHVALLTLDTIQLCRVYRLTFSCRELFLLTKSILHSLRSLQWTALFVFCVIYTCAIFCTWTFYDADDAEMSLLWGNLILSMFTLFTVLTLEGWNGVANSTAEKHPFSRIFFVCFICFTTLTLLNIVTGIILDAYVDMSSRLAAEASYHEHLEKDARNEDLLTKAFQQTEFLFSLPASAAATSGFRNWTSLSRSSGEGNKLSLDSGGPKKVPEAGSSDREKGEERRSQAFARASTGTFFSPAHAEPDREASAASAFFVEGDRTFQTVGQCGSSAGRGAKLERKTTGLTSECSTTARPPTEGNDGSNAGSGEGAEKGEKTDKCDRDEKGERGEDRGCAARKAQETCGVEKGGGDGDGQGPGSLEETEDEERRRERRSTLDGDSSGDAHEDSQAWNEKDRKPKQSGAARFLRRVQASGIFHLGRKVPHVEEEKKDERKVVACLNLANLHPLDILQHPAILDALEKAGIPLFQAFDVLNLYYTRGVEFITVKEFAESCGRVCGTSTGRQLLQMQIDLHQKLNRVEKRVRRLTRALVQQQQLVLLQQQQLLSASTPVTRSRSIWGWSDRERKTDFVDISRRARFRKNRAIRPTAAHGFGAAIEETTLPEHFLPKVGKIPNVDTKLGGSDTVATLVTTDTHRVLWCAQKRDFSKFKRGSFYWGSLFS
ncbi:transporter, cation channel family protein [Toxoplasma gondii RUB]|uniref:Transporter, cation channel family protein n=2 Tax=Toxoplasma gondii TaxID=5811 RepID=A0A086LQP4_TOXGO|nr:transporter, cation channel family protein [Toxoplasma gondii p89]KFG58962.1 transporter, cation channel family protein [Toxoplasma gondii RUB]